MQHRYYFYLFIKRQHQATRRMSLRETFFKPLAKLKMYKLFFTNQWSDPEPNKMLDPDVGKNNSNLDPEDGIILRKILTDRLRNFRLSFLLGRVQVPSPDREGLDRSWTSPPPPPS